MNTGHARADAPAMVRQIRLGDPEYPQSLHDLGRDKPHSFTVEGDFTPASPRVAIVGSRAALENIVELVKRIAGAVASAGGIVISGGAFGVDTAAHVGALNAGGRTWSVIAAGAPKVTPQKNKDVFDRILANGGAIVRTREDVEFVRGQHLDRNRVLIALAEVVVIAQAASTGGTMSSATSAIKLARPSWVVPGMPWHEKEFAGSWALIHGKNPNMRVVTSETELLKEIGGRPPRTLKTPKGLTDDELKVLSALGNGCKHPDELALETGLPTPAVTTALLTLALGDVVVEGLAGLFQRKGPA